jgi:prepilin-type processing-associated H-X9-DG protein
MAEGNDARQRRRPRFGVLTVLLVTGVAMLPVAFLVLTKRTRQLASRVPFGASISGLAKSLMVYANDDEFRRLPPADKWCDFLVQYDYSPPRQFIRNRSDAVIGESQVAINKYLAGKSLSDIPGDTVLLFETDFGIAPAGRNELLKNRSWYKFQPYGDPNAKVYKYRWNQAGGPEILTTRYHYTEEHGGGCNVAFVDTHVRYVKAADLPKLKFKPDPNDFDRAYRTYFLTEPNRLQGH